MRDVWRIPGRNHSWLGRGALLNLRAVLPTSVVFRMGSVSVYLVERYCVVVCIVLGVGVALPFRAPLV